MEVRVLGPLEVAVDGESVPLGAPKQRTLLLDLVLHANEVVPTAHLIEDIWGDRAPRTAQHSVQLYVSELRKALGRVEGERIVTRSPGYELRIDPESIDAVRFEHLVDRARDLLVTGPDAAKAATLEALGLWRGPALADVAYEEFAQAEIRRLEELRLEAADLRDEARVALGDHRSTLPDLRKRVEQQPLRERTRALFVEALAGSGRQAEALRTAQDLRRRLAEELGVEPGPDLAQLEERILLRDPAVHRGPSERTDRPVRNPYKGLRPFHEADAADFHGRQRLMDEICAALLDHRFVSVVGPSGSGKSSVLRAGVVPWARAGPRFDPVVMVPGARPVAALGAALGCTLGSANPAGAVAEAARASDREVLVLIDQFEELYSLCDETTRHRFIELLVETHAAELPIRFVVALRADYYDRPLADAVLGAVFTSTVVNVPPMSLGELEAAALAPAKATGLHVEPELLAAILSDTVGQPGGLPLFEFSLTDLANTSVDGRLTAEAYAAAGGARGALALRAEEAMSGLSDGTDVARQVLLRLVEVGGDSTVTRRRVGAAELLALGFDGVAVREVLEGLGEHRLLTFDRDAASGRATVELAHDALVTEWGRLAAWVGDALSDLRRRAALATAVAEWEDAGRSEDYLPSGEQLRRYETWRADAAVALTDEEHAYLDRAQRRQDAAEERERARSAAEARLRRSARNRLILSALLVLAIAAAAVAAFVAARPGGPRIALVVEVESDFSDVTGLLMQGWERAAREIDFRGEVVTPKAGPVDEVRSLAESGYDLIIAGGSQFSSALETVADEHPGIDYAVIDIYSEHPSVTSALFDVSDGSFLAGAAAALVSESGVVGFVGGAPAPLIEEFRAGYEAGARHIDPEIEVLATYVTRQWPGYTAFTRPDLGQVAGTALYELGADVVYHAAGASGLGVFDAAGEVSEETGVHRWAIGVDLDEYVFAAPELKPHVLTSMLKRADVAIERVIEEHVEGRLEPGVMVFGLAEDAVGLSPTGGHLDPWLPWIAELEAAIVAGEIVVPTVPRGDTLPPPDPGGYDVLATLSSAPCAYAGPHELDPGTIVRLEATNASEQLMVLGLVPLSEDLTVDEINELGAEAVETVFVGEFTIVLLGPGERAAVTSPALMPGPYAVACSWEDYLEAAGVIHVR